MFATAGQAEIWEKINRNFLKGKFSRRIVSKLGYRKRIKYALSDINKKNFVYPAGLLPKHRHRRIFE